MRLAVTDRCNLRCFYCMPEEGINYVPRKELLTYEEMERLVRVVAKMGISKLRLTGGEPFLRKDFMPFLERLCAIEGIEQVHLTTNGTLTAPHIPALKRLGIKSVNLSLDSLDKQRFLEITRRDSFEEVMRTFHLLLEAGISTKLNAVVMEGRNIDDILPMVELTKAHPVSVRFIEEMPFNGSGATTPSITWDQWRIMEHIRTVYPQLQKIKDAPYSTSFNYSIPGHLGTVGVIAAFSRSFCGTCNRIRVTPQGMLKTCLYDSGVFNLREFMRQDASDEALAATILEALAFKPKDGFEAEQQRKGGLPVSESMATIGG